MATLDSTVRNLLKVIEQVKSLSSNGLDLLKTSKPYWHLCIEKFHAAYIKAKNPEGFRDMFRTFYDKHSDKFLDDVIDDGDINDEWLKNKEVLTKAPKSKKKTSDDLLSFSLRNINCRGEVIYFDESNEKIRNVSVPISEAYLTACKIYSDGAKEGEYSPLPAQLLHALYDVMAQVCDDDDKKKLNKNVKALKEVIDSLTENDEENNGTGDTINPLSNVIKTFASKFGLGGKDGNMNMGNIEKTISGLFSDDVASQVKGVWNTFNEKIKIDEKADIGTIINNVSEAMKDDSLQESIKSTIVSVASKVGFGEIKFSEEEKEKIQPTTGDATEQE